MQRTCTVALVAAATALTLALPAGPALAKTKPPMIKSVKFKGTPSEPLVVVKGRGLGSIPAGEAEEVPNCYGEEPSGLGNDFGTVAVFSDLTTGWDAGEGPGDCIGVRFKTYTETEVAFELGSAYGQYTPLHTGDEYSVTLYGLTKSGTVKIREKKVKETK